MTARPSCPSTRYAAFGGSIRKLPSPQSLSRKMLQGCRNTATNSVREKNPRICASCTASAIPTVDHISEVRNNCLRIHSLRDISWKRNIQDGKASPRTHASCSSTLLSQFSHILSSSKNLPSSRWETVEVLF